MEQLLKELISKSLGDSSVLPAWKEFEKVGLPQKKSEEYKFSPVTKILERDLQVASADKMALPADVPGNKLLSESYCITFVNGLLAETELVSNDQLEIRLIEKTDLDDPRFQANWKDSFHLLNKSVLSPGIFIKIRKGQTLDKPVYIRYISDKRESQSVGFTKLYVHAEENSEAKIVEDFQYIGNNVSFDSSETHFFTEKHSRLKSYTLQLDGTEQIHVGNTFVQQDRESNFENMIVSMKGKMIRNNLQIWQNDEHCESHLYGLYMLNGKTHVDNHTTVDHQKPNSFSNQKYKGILDEQSTGVFNGKIYVRPNAQNTNAFQSNNNLLLSETATLHTKPQLEIWADDVKCSHGCTTGQIDREAMFYLQTRGLNERQAKSIMLKAFVFEILEKISLEEIRETVENRVDSLLFNS